MKIHYQNKEGKETFIDNVIHLQNVNDFLFVATLNNGKELNLRVSGIEGITDSVLTENLPNNWISVDNGLPENGVEVLCWYEYFRYGNYNCMYQTYGIGFCFNGRWGGEVMNGTKPRVIAWMPMPEKPLEDNNNES